MTKIEREIKCLNLDTAEAFIAVTIHRENGRLVPTLTIIADCLSVEQQSRIGEAVLTAAGNELRIRPSDQPA